jgi:hypothetical protein
VTHAPTEENAPDATGPRHAAAHDGVRIDSRAALVCALGAAILLTLFGVVFSALA